MDMDIKIVKVLLEVICEMGYSMVIDVVQQVKE